MQRLKSKMTYANVIATIALFLALGGGAYAAKVKLGKNAVKTKSIKNLAVTEAKLGNNAVTEKKVKPFTFTNASGFQNGWSSTSGNPVAQYGKDALGVVHVRGTINGGTNNTPAFTLPADMRPNGLRTFAIIGGLGNPCEVSVNTNGNVVPFNCNNLVVSLDVTDFVAGR
jgi:hypothetical protein